MQLVLLIEKCHFAQFLNSLLINFVNFAVIICSTKFLANRRLPVHVIYLAKLLSQINAIDSYFNTDAKPSCYPFLFLNLLIISAVNWR